MRGGFVFYGKTHLCYTNSPPPKKKREKKKAIDQQWINHSHPAVSKSELVFENPYQPITTVHVYKQGNSH